MTRKPKTAQILETCPEDPTSSISPELHMLPSNSIVTGHNIRRDLDENSIGELAESIRVNGIIEPLVVCRREDDPLTYLLVAGERRYRAASVVGLDSLPCHVYPALSQSQVLEIMFTENLHRKDLNPMEEAEGIRRLLDAGMTQDEVGSRLGKSQEWVSNRLRLLDAPESLRNGVISQEMTPSHILKLLTYRSKVPEDMFSAFVDYFVDHKVDPEGDPVPVSGIDELFKKFLSKHSRTDDSIVLYARFSLGETLYNEHCTSCLKNIMDGHACLDRDCLDRLREHGSESRTASERDDRLVHFGDGRYGITEGCCVGCARMVSDDGTNCCSDRKCFEARTQDFRERVQGYRRCIDDALRDSIKEVCSEDPRGMFIRFSNDLLDNSFGGVRDSGITIDETDSETIILEKLCMLQFMSSIGMGFSSTDYVLSQYRNFCKDHGIKPKDLMSWDDCIKEVVSEMSRDIPLISSEPSTDDMSEEEAHA